MTSPPKESNTILTISLIPHPSSEMTSPLKESDNNFNPILVSCPGRTGRIRPCSLRHPFISFQYILNAEEEGVLMLNDLKLGTVFGNERELTNNNNENEFIMTSDFEI